MRVIISVALLATGLMAQTSTAPATTQGSVQFSSPGWIKSMPKIWTFERPKVEPTPQGALTITPKQIGFDGKPVTCTIPLLRVDAGAKFNGDPKMVIPIPDRTGDSKMVIPPAPVCESKR